MHAIKNVDNNLREVKLCILNIFSNLIQMRDIILILNNSATHKTRCHFGMINTGQCRARFLTHTGMQTSLQ